MTITPRSGAFGPTLRRWYAAHRGWLGYLAIVVVAVVLFAQFQYVNVFADPDSFYHAKMAVLLRDGQFSRTFDALPFTTLASAFADQHFLYHLLLVPFVTVIDPLIGLKLATIVLGAVMAFVFYWCLRRWGVRWAFATTVLLLLVNPFTFRMNLAKASSLSITLLLIGLAAAFAYRPWVVGWLAGAYVWFYGGFPLLVGSVLVFAIVSAIHRRLVRRDDGNRLLQRVRGLLGRAFRERRVRRLNLRLVVAVLLGTTVGLVFNPFFPSNLRFEIDQLIRIGLVNYQRSIGVGGEWYPYGFVELLANTALVSIPVLVALVLAAVRPRRQSTRAWTLMLLWLGFFALTLKSRRYIEYEVPFGLLYAAVSLHDSLGDLHWRDFVRPVRDALGRWSSRIGLVAVATYVAILVPTIVVRDFISEKRDLANGFALTSFQAESAWIREHTRPGAVVFHSDWDEFPPLFYYNSQSRYIAGLDPTFLYLADRHRYWQWANVTLGRETGDVWSIVRGTFNADVVVVEHDHDAMRRLIERDEHFRLAFHGPLANVYDVGPSEP